MWKLTAYNNFNALLLFLPVMLFMGELPLVMESSDIYSSSYWMLMTLAGLFGKLFALSPSMHV
jgi:GDP-fucose transporter C1